MPIFVVRVDLDHDVSDALRKATDRLGMTQLSMASRMVKWMARQDADIQTGIMNDRASGAVASTVLKKLAKIADQGAKKKG